jgi:hypothetical protein
MSIAENQKSKSLKGQNAELVKYFKNTPSNVKKSIVKDYNAKYKRREVDLGRVLSALLKKGIAPVEVINHFRNPPIYVTGPDENIAPIFSFVGPQNDYFVLDDSILLAQQQAEQQAQQQAEQQAKQEEKRQNQIFKLNSDFENLLINKKPFDVDVEDLNEVGLGTGDFFNLINKFIVESDKMVLKVTGADGNIVTRPLNDKTLMSLDRLRNGEFYEIGGSWSDPIFAGSFYNSSNFSISRVENKASYSNKSGKFFPYHNQVGEYINLEKYGVYKELNKEIIAVLTSGNCLMLALIRLGLSKEKTEQLKYMCLLRFISKSKLKLISEELDIFIILYEKHQTTKALEISKYGINKNETYEIALYEGHYFIYEDVPYTAYSITNILTIKNQKDYNLINKVQYKKGIPYYNRERNPPRFIKSLDAVMLLKENQKLTPITRETQNILKTVFYDNFKPNYDVVNPSKYNFRCADKEQEKERKYAINPKKYPLLPDINTDPDYRFATFDFETRTDLITKKIIAIVGVLRYGDTKETHIVYGGSSVEVGLLLLNKIKGPTLLCAHNSKFDYGFISVHMRELQEVMADGRFITAKGYFKDNAIKIIDFYNFVPIPLSKFGSTFKLSQHKEFIPYELYNDYDVIDNKFIDVLDVLNNKKYISNENQKEIFLNNLEKWQLLTNDKTKFNALKYCVEYCVLDCIVLCEAFEKFRGWIDEAIGIDILKDKCLTASGIARKVLQNEECLTDCYAHSGNFLEFINKFCIGGRTMCSNNEKQIANAETDALDANSLYPSAIVELGGYLKGAPKKLSSLKYEDIKNFTGYFVRIIISKVGIERSMPLISKLNEEGIRIFTNDLLNQTHYVDKITLEDLIEFQKIEFEIIDGFYYDEGRNENVVDLVNTLYDTRKKCVAENNPMELVYKLILNSAYGINLENPHDEQIRIFDDKDKFEIYLDRNHQTVKQFMDFGDKKVRVISQQEIGTHFNTNHIGCEILSMSKRIMNRVICLAEDNENKIYYQDTDSLFIDASKKDLIIKNFEMKYSRPLIGADLGQFKGDLKIKYSGKTAKNTVGYKSVFLGKKCYYIGMRGERDDGTFIYEDKLRMAGIPSSTLEHTRCGLNISNAEMYSKLYKGDVITYDLCEHNHELNTTKFRVAYDKNLNKTLKTEFTRTRQF